MNIVLHIGTDKTGSTAIQHSLWRNREWLQANGIFLPSTGFGWDNGHAALLQDLDQVGLEALSAELLDAKAAGFTTAILSWEGMCRYSDAQIKRLLDLLGDQLPNEPVTILVYLREQGQIMQSAHVQWIQMSDSAISIQTLADARNPFEWITRSLFLRHPRRNYFKLLSRWKKIRSELRFNIRVFDKNSLVEGDVISDFITQVGLTLDGSFATTSNNTNPSLAVETALLLERWKNNPGTQSDIPAAIDLAQLIIEIEGPSSKYFLSKASVDKIRRNFRSSNERLASLVSDASQTPIFTMENCWRTEIFTQTQRRANRLQERLDEESVLPTLAGTATGASLATELSLGTGWSSVEDWGVWSMGNESTISLRVLNGALAGDVQQITLLLRGRYYASNTTTELTLNGKSYGKLKLDDEQGAITLQIADLLPLNRIDITLSHEAPVSPMSRGEGEDERTLAFALTEMGYEPVRQ